MELGAEVKIRSRNPLVGGEVSSLPKLMCWTSIAPSVNLIIEPDCLSFPSKRSSSKEILRDYSLRPKQWSVDFDIFYDLWSSSWLFYCDTTFSNMKSLKPCHNNGYKPVHGYKQV